MSTVGGQPPRRRRRRRRRRRSCTPSYNQKRPANLHLGVTICVRIVSFLGSKTGKSREFPVDATPSGRHFLENGARLSEALITSCRGDTNPIRMFSARELMEATDNYDQRRFLGSGLSRVYSGVHDGRPIAVKVAGISLLPHAVRSLSDMFLNEVVSLSQINHRNVVRLLGCCVETRVPILVCELVPGGGLHQRINTAEASRRIPWADRLRIALEVADALNYLHTALRTPIVHGTVRSLSILLDGCCSAKVANFGFSELVPGEDRRARKGSSGDGSNANSDPGYDFGQRVTEKNDVYGFGVVLIELLTGKEPLEGEFGGAHTISLDHFVSSAQEGLLDSVLDASISSEANPEQLMACACIAIRSISGDVEARPTMKELVQELRHIRR